MKLLNSTILIAYSCALILSSNTHGSDSILSRVNKSKLQEWSEYNDTSRIPDEMRNFLISISYKPLGPNNQERLLAVKLIEHLDSPAGETQQKLILSNLDLRHGLYSWRQVLAPLPTTAPALE